MTSTFHAEEEADGLTYRVHCTVDAQQGLTLTVHGADSHGTVHASGELHLPATGGAAVGACIARVLKAHAHMQPRRRPSPANANNPWTADESQALRAAWLTPSTTGDPSQRIRELADQMQRSTAAVRTRLGRIGCDPDVVGRALSPDVHLPESR